MAVVGQEGIDRGAPKGLSERQIFWSVMALAAGVRFFASIPFMVGWYDEIWQYLEPAWHLIKGPWVVTWEYRYDIRSWLLPQIISVPMALGLALDPSGTIHLWLPRLFAATLSLTVVGCATQLGFRISRLHGLVAGVVAATWFELVFYAPRIQAETIAFSVFMGAVWLVYGRRYRASFGQFFAVGLLLGLSLLLRAQYGPIVILFALYVVKFDFRAKWVPVLLGGCLAILADVVANVSVGKPPLLWVWESYRIIIIDNRISLYSDQPFAAYLGMISIYWGVIFVAPIAMLAWRGMKYYPILFWVAVVNFLIHSMISHKEYRFVMASTAIFIILAALGMADVIRQSPERKRRSILIASLGVWVLASAALANAVFKPHWTFLTDLAKVHDIANAAYDPKKSCGFAILAPRSSVSGSYAMYRRDRPIYAFDDVGTLAQYDRSFNVIVTKQEFLPSLPSSFRLKYCGDSGMSDTPACVVYREGSCSGDPTEHHINAWLKRHDN